MASFATLKVSPIQGSPHAVRLTVTNPPLNTVDATLLKELHAYLESLAEASSSTPKVVVVSSSIPEVWISHLDLHIISARYPLSPGLGDPGNLLHFLGGIIRLFNELSIVFIAEVDGLAVGGGNEFAVNMDMRFAGPGARFGVPEVAGGIIHGGGLQRLTKLLGPGRAFEMMASARAVTHRDAERFGLVNRATDSSEHLREFVDALAVRIALFPRSGIEATKRGIQECLVGEGSLAKDMQRLEQLAHTEDAQAAIAKLIEYGEGEGGREFELGLPDTEGKLWETASTS